MRKTKRALAVLLSIIMVISLMPTSVVAFANTDRLSYDVEYSDDFSEAMVLINFTPEEIDSLQKLQVDGKDVTNQIDEATFRIIAKENHEYDIEALFSDGSTEKSVKETIVVDRLINEQDFVASVTSSEASADAELADSDSEDEAADEAVSSPDVLAEASTDDESADNEDEATDEAVSSPDAPAEANADAESADNDSEDKSEESSEAPLLRGGADADEETPEYLTVRINWVADEESAALEAQVRSRLSNPSFSIYKDGAVVKTVSLSSSNNWEITVEDCPLFDDDGNPITFEVKKNGNANAYQPAYSYEITEQNGTFTDTETFHPTHTFTVTVSFQDETNNFFNTLPEELFPENARLTMDSYLSEVADSVTKNEDGSYTVIFTDVPTYYRNGTRYALARGVYWFESDDIPGQYARTILSRDTTYYAAQDVRYRMQTTSYSLNWKLDAGNVSTAIFQDTMLANGVEVPEQIQFTLLFDGEVANCKDPTVTFYRNANGTWSNQTASWILPYYDENGKAIAYNDHLSVYYTPNQAEGTLPLQYVESYALVNSSRRFDISFKYKNIYPRVFSTWEDGGNAAGTRPDVTMTLMANGVPADNAQPWMVSKDDTNNKYLWQYLPQRDSAGNYIHYTLQPEGLPAYYRLEETLTPAFSEATGYEGTSTTASLRFDEKFVLLSQHASADVVWVSNGEDLSNNLRPTNVMLSLLYSDDDGATWKEYWGKQHYSVTSSQDESGKTWHYEWDLPQCDAEGNPIIFKAVQNPLHLYTTEHAEEYETDDSGNTTSHFQITNTYQDVPWDYLLDLKWDSSDPGMQIHNEVATYLENYHWDVANKTYTGEKAVLTISVNMDYDVGDLEVRMPYSLFPPEACRDGYVEGVQIGLPEAPGTNPTYFFNYTIDKHGSNNKTDWEIVFSNWNPLEKGYNISIPIVYKFNPYYVIDCSTTEITAVGKGQGATQSEPVEHTSNEISFRLDTGVSAPSGTMVKGAVNYTYTPGGCIYSWRSSYGFPEEEFDPQTYNYVFYMISSPTIRFNQPCYFEFTETPGQNGRVVSFYSADGRARDVTYDSETGTWKTRILTLADRENRSSNNSYDKFRMAFFDSPDWYVVVAYPRAEMPAPPPGQTTNTAVYTNAVNMKVIAADEHDGDKGAGDTLDIVELSDSASMIWTDYVFNYTGELYAGDKSFALFDQGALTAMEYGNEQRTSTSFSATVNGYNLENGYSFELYDDAVYAYAVLANGGTTDAVRLSSEDFEFHGGNYSSGSQFRIDIRSTDVDRTNGNTIAGMVADDPFVLYARTDGGAWEEIATIEMSEYSGTTLDNGIESYYYYLPGSLLDGKGYTALKLVSPEGLQGQFYVRVSVHIVLFPTSPVLSAWAEDENVSSVSVTNFNAVKLFYPDVEGGEYKWQNPLSTTYNSAAARYGLSAEDLAENGAYVYRKSENAGLTRATTGGSMSKSIASASDNVADGTYSVRFNLIAREYITGKLDEDFYESWMAQSGTFYDLLPAGFAYDSTKTITVRGAYSGSGTSYYDNSELVSVETINNYRDTGRQMVIIRVKARDGQNNHGGLSYEARRHTGFCVQFYAIATYEDIILYGSGYNNAVYQRGDLATVGGGGFDIGHTAVAANDKYFPQDGNGNFVLQDVNEDGETGTKNTQFAFCEVSPRIVYSIQTGISKSVRANSGIYSHADAVNPDGEYAYRILVQTTDKGVTKDLIIYDSLERANLDSGWKGTLTGVNVSAMRQKGVDVKVYYSTTAISDIDAAALSLDSGHWQLLQAGTDLTQVKALAFDMRQNVNGEEMVFENNSSIFVEIYMRAPGSVQHSEFAYNRPAYSCTVMQEGSDIESPMSNVGNVTSVALSFPQDIVFNKAYVDDTDNDTVKPLAGVTFDLYRCTNTEEGHEHYGTSASNSCWGNRISRVVTGEDGLVRFSGLTTGDYKVVETSAPRIFDYTSYRYWLYHVDSAKATISDPVCCIISGTFKKVEMEQDGETGDWTLINPRVTRDIRVNKSWTEDSAHVIRPDLTFELYRNEELYRTEVLPASETYIVFENLPRYDWNGNLYRYVVKEVEADGYQISGNAEKDVTGSEYVIVHSTSFTNVRLGVLDISKLVVPDGQTDEFTFTVQLSSTALDKVQIRKYASAAADEYTIEDLVLTEDGLITFTLKDGERVRIIGLPLNARYTVSEIAQDGYTSAVTSGSVTGTTSSTAIGSVVFTNTRDTYGDLTVSKTVSGNAASSTKEFSFTVALTDTSINGTYGDMTFENGVAAFTLKGGESKKAEGLPNGVGYTVSENDYSSDGYVTTKTGDIGTIVGDETQTAAFTNTRNAEGSLTVSKTVEGNDADTTKEFSFTVTLSDTTISGTYGDMTFENGVATFTLKGGESKTAEGLPNGIGYAVEEADYSNDGYVTTKTGNTGTIDENSPAIASFTNTRNTYGSLTVSKTISGNAADATKEFAFTVTLSDTTISGTYGDMTFENGVATFTLKGGESKTASSLPNGVGYAVTENDYSGDGYVTVKTGDTGAIVGDETQTAAFTNTRNAEGSLTVAKTVEGNDADTSKEFSFTVTLSDTTISGTYGDVTFENGIATFTLKGGESKVIEDLPNGTSYVVEEADYRNDGYVTEKTGDTGAIDENTPAVASFTNTRDTYGDLTVSKTISGNAADATKEFAFTVTLSDTTISGTYGDMTFENGVATFTLKGGESKTASSLPNGVGYAVTENDYSGDGYVTVKTGDTGAIVGDETQTAAFTNTRNAEGSLTVAKTVEGNDADTSKEFSFTVTLSDTTISGTYGDMTFENGVATFTLKGGERKTASGLPNSVGYTVEEADYSSDGYVTTKTGDTGTIPGGGTVTAAFVNTKNTVVPPSPPRTGNLTISKTVTGEMGDRSKYFSFRIEFDAEGSFSYTGSKSGEISSGGTVQLKHGESITISGLPAGTKYSVTESGNTEYRVYVTGDVGTIVADQTATAKFTNTRSKVPITGDNSHTTGLLTLMSVSLLGIITTLAAGRKRKRTPGHLKKR